MDSNFKSFTTGAMAPQLIKGFRLSWLLYGAAAYFGLKYLNKSGILTKQTKAALDFIDHGIETVKEKVGFDSAVLSPAKTATTNNYSPKSIFSRTESNDRH